MKRMICLFCLDNVNEPIEDLFDCECTLCFHKQCMEIWLKHGFTCPICRKPDVIIYNNRIQRHHSDTLITFTLFDIIESIINKKVLFIWCSALCITFILLLLLLLFKELSKIF